MLWLRWLMVALTGLIAVVLLANGNTVLGVLFAALTIVRALLLLSIKRRRAQLAARFPRRFGN